MQCWKAITAAGLVLVGISGGCGQSSRPEVARTQDSSEVSSSNGSSRTETTSGPHDDRSSSSLAPTSSEVDGPVPHLTSDSPPDAVVSAFLEATRRGDDQLAASLLSQKALEETTKIGLAVKPPGTPSMEYHIQGAEFVEHVPEGAYVHSTWTEQHEGELEQYEVTWILRQEEIGWRIVGMAAEMNPDEPPYVLNFEEPSELYRQMQQFAEESETGDQADFPGEDGVDTARQPLRSASPSESDSNQLR
jgi:hypothetical protein